MTRARWRSSGPDWALRLRNPRQAACSPSFEKGSFSRARAAPRRGLVHNELPDRAERGRLSPERLGRGAGDLLGRDVAHVLG